MTAVDNSNYTPMMQQYMAVKQEHQDKLLFFRLGDFYEMFFEDAITASRELNITLTKRSNSSESTPMCGVPYHSVDGYIAKLIKKGYRIAICEQVEDPKLAKGIVQRKVTKIITPGTAINEQLLEEKHNRYLVIVGGDDIALCLAAADVTTGECLWYLAEGEDGLTKLTEQLFRMQPTELVADTSLPQWDMLHEWLGSRLPECSVSCVKDGAGADFFAQHFPETEATALVKKTVGALLAYLHETVRTDLSHINRLEEIVRDDFMNLDAAAIRNLELVRNMKDGSRRGTLLDIIDFTKTSMGARRLRNWVENPLLDIGRIYERQGAVEDLQSNGILRERLEDCLKTIYDLERILSRIEIGSANARDLAALRTSLKMLPPLKAFLCQESKAGLLQKLANSVSLHEDIADVLTRAIVDEPPFSVREGGMIRSGYHAELDELHLIAGDNKTWLQNFEQRIKEESGIKTMRVGFNKVFGYYIEVSKGQSNSVPEYFVRKQTLVNAERYIVPELKEFENKILGAKEKIQTLEYYLFDELRGKIRGKISAIQETAKAIACIDALNSMAVAAYKYSYIRPELNNNGEIKINEGRHPVVERLLEKEIFVPNNVSLNSGDERTMIITGPNMAGKSTYMRQVALLVLLTQMGSFIPARSASIAPVDKIFTRVGASDDLATGQSTFMVEMNEVAQILRYATSKSLIILDEVGRGTSTYDGMSIARAVVEYVQQKIKAKTLFATHYHQLIALEDELPGVKNYSVAVKERGKDIIFLRRIVPGGTDRSYGVHVARLAGLPKKVLDRAEEILKTYDSEESVVSAGRSVGNGPEMNSLFAGALAEKLLQLDVVSMTPIEAMNTLYCLQDEARKESGGQ